MLRTRSIVAAVLAAAFAPSAFAGGAEPGRPTPTEVSARVRAASAAAVTVGRDYRLADAILVADGAPPAPTAPTAAPPVTVYGSPTPTVTQYEGPTQWNGGYSPTGLGQDTRIGPAGQPEWTTDRRFSRVRTYVIAPGQVEFESWYYGRYKKNGDVRHIWQEEIAIGLPHRFMFDMYVNIIDDEGGDSHALGGQFELRYAFADWGCLPLNPTAYVEYKVQEADEPDVAELKLLLSDGFGCGWVYGLNFAYERELSGEKEEVLGFSAGISRTVIDQRLNVGAEFQVERATVEGARGEPEYEVLFGPSVQFQLSHTTHLDISPLFGLTETSPEMKLYVIFGIDLSPGGEGGWYDPISSRSR
jgi:hypothetical protein